MNRTKTLIRLGAVLLVAGVMWGVYVNAYAKPRTKLLGDISAARASAASLEEKMRDQFKVADRVRAAGERTLGPKFDTMSARFRDGLARIAESQGLESITVDHGEPQPQTNPLINVQSVPRGLKTALRRPADFAAVRGSVRGTGTLEQVLRTVATAQAQGWIHRIEGFTIKPVGRDRERCEIRLDVATIYAPDFSRGADPEPVFSVMGEGAAQVATALAERQPFRRRDPAPPPPVVVAETAPQSQQHVPQPRPIPYDEWRLTGVLGGRDGAEVFFQNVKNGQRLTLHPGGRVLDAVLISAAGETAVLEIGGERFEIRNGQTLAVRTPVGQIQSR
jgi:hypothetical protein